LGKSCSSTLQRKSGSCGRLRQVATIRTSEISRRAGSAW
jgi:hypothetical protein